MSKIGPDHYRFQEVTDEQGVLIVCSVFVCIAETPRGYWVVAEHFASFSAEYQKRHRRFVLKDSYRRHCYPDKNEALKSYLKRKKMQLQHITHQKQVIEQLLPSITDMVEKGVTPDNYFNCGRPACFDNYTWDF